MPTLLQINVTANWGSTGRIAEDIGRTAIEHGWDSYIAYGRYVSPSQSRLIKVGNKYDAYAHYLRNRLFDGEGLGSQHATRRLIGQIKDLSPDIIHLHNIHDHWLNYPILFEYLAGADTPVVWTQHDHWALTGHCCYIPSGCEKWRTSCCDCPLQKKKLFDRSRRNYLQKKELFASLKSLTLVPVSEWLGTQVLESFYKGCDIKVIHNGIDIEMFSPQISNVRFKYDIDGKKIVLGVASEWSTRKGLDDFYKLAQLLPEEYIIIIIGKILGKRNDINGASYKMRFIDRTQNAQELAQLYSAAMVFVNPTYQDNYPTTNLEAMSCGTPVITYRTGGSPEAITPETGWVVEQGNIHSIAKIIMKLAQMNEGERFAQRKACRERAVKFFNKNERFEEYIKLYEALIKESKNQ